MINDFIQRIKPLINSLAVKVNNNEIDFNQLETELVSFVYELGHLMEQEILDQVNEPTLENTIQIEGKKYYFKARRNLSFINRFGSKVAKARRCYYAKDGSPFNPLDDQLGFSICKGFSPLVTYLLSLFGGDDAFEKSSPLLSQTLGFSVSGTAVQDNTEHTGSHIPESPYDFVPSEMESEASDLFVFEVDGTTSPQIEPQEGIEGRASLKAKTHYKECNVVAVEKHQGYKKQRFYGAKYGDRESFRQYAMRFGLAAGQLKTRQGVFIADGLDSNWILWKDAFHTFVPILDYYHATEHLYDFGSYFKDEKEGKEIASDWCDLLHEGEILEVLAQMRSALKILKPDKRKDGEREIKYFEKNQNYMQYDEYRTKNFPIGSGMIEAGCKRVVCKRFKGNGMRWKKEDNEKVLRVRLALLNQTLHRYFCGNLKRWRKKRM